MRSSYDFHAEGPFAPITPDDPFQRSVLNSAEHSEDVQSKQLLHALLLGLPRPPSQRERQAATDDLGAPPRVYAPASARVPKKPLPCDAEILAEGRHHTITAESALHPGDRSDPAERR
jgi:hypothetical protein